MRSLEGRYREFDDPAAWMPLVWTLLVLFSAAFAAALALPTLPAYLGAATPRDIFHPEWLVLASLLVLPVYRAARLSWRAALFAVPVACVQVLYVADTAISSLRQAGLASGLSNGWYVVALVQTVLFVTVGITGARRDLVDRRWVRSMRRATALPAPDRINRSRRS